MFGLPRGVIAYDIETYPDLFTAVFKHTETGQTWIFEISERKNETQRLKIFINKCRDSVKLVGFNNYGFDYPVIHHLCCHPNPKAIDMYAKAMSIINGDRFSSVIWDKDQLVQQIDLFKIWHFDNMARATSLKLLEFNMRMDKIQECDVPFGTNVPLEDIDKVIDYNIHDVNATIDFYKLSKDKIAFRQELSSGDSRVINYNDTKIGKEHFISKLEEAKKGSCWEYIDNRRQPRQTKRDTIPFNKLILPCVKFESEEFKTFFESFKQIEVKETKGSLENVHCIYKGFQFDFGTGGIHGSVHREHITKGEDEVILDIDVASYYPNLAIANKFYPAHLGELFCEIYSGLYEQRKQYSKKDPINGMLKLALNGVYGDSNSPFSPFYDPWFTMQITLNGQLLLCMLAEQIMKVAELIQINTDGMTLKCKRKDLDYVRECMSKWEFKTRLTLEEVEYSKMLVRDVNNYLAMTIDGEVKEKGAYETKRELHKNHSMLVVPEAVREWFISGTPVEDFIRDHADPLDFCLRTKIKKKDKVFWGNEEQQKITRYYIATEGNTLIKIMPSVGEPGQWRRKSKLTNDFYNQILNSLPKLEITKVEDGYTYLTKYGNERVVQPKYFSLGVEVDSCGRPWDERINTKAQTKYDNHREVILNDKKPVQVCNNLEGHTFSDIDVDWYIGQAHKLIEGMILDEE